MRYAYHVARTISLRRYWSQFRRARRGVAAAEFALIAPVLAAMCAGLYDLTTAFIASQRLNMAALSIAQISTYQAANSAQINSNLLDLAEISAAGSAIYAYLPDTMSAAVGSFAVIVTSVVVTLTDPACTASCTYVSNVAWTGRYQGGAGSTRSCGTNAMTWTANTDAPSASTLPTYLQQPQPVLVVDVYYTFKPLFYKFITGNIAMMRSAYFPPRTGMPSDWIQYYPTGAADPTTECAGYPASTLSP